MRYERMAKLLRARMGAMGITSNEQLRAALLRIGCSVHPNMVSRWLQGHSRPQDDRLEAVLDVLGVLQLDERRRARELAYTSPARLDAENRESDPSPGVA